MPGDSLELELFGLNRSFIIHKLKFKSYLNLREKIQAVKTSSLFLSMLNLLGICFRESFK